MKQLITLLGSLLFLAGCTFISTLPQANDLSAAAGKLVLIGKVELVPPFEPDKEQDTHWNVIGDSRMVNKLFLALGAKFQPLATGRPRMSEWQSTMEVVWNEPFMLESKFRTAWINGGVVQFDSARQDYMWFPGGLRYQAPAGAEAVYVGTVRFYRDDFNNILSVEVLDEYDKTLRDLKIQNQNHRVTRSLFQPQALRY